MKLNKYIKELEKILKSNGDMECCYAIDDEGNRYNLVVYEPSVLYKRKDDDNSKDIQVASSDDDIKLELDIFSDNINDEAEKIVCVN